MDFRSKQMAPPEYWQQFEDLCLALFKAIWNNPLAVKHGRNGQPQHGVDIFGSPLGARDVFHGVQCKGKLEGYGAEATVDELEAELGKAESFSPQLEHWVFATTALADVKLQVKARELSVERKARGAFTVSVLGWGDIKALLAQYPNVLQDFYPEHAFNLPELIAAIQQYPAGEEVRDLINVVRQLLAHPANASPSAISVSAWETVHFDEARDLSPALLGQPLGPSDAAVCPRLYETDLLVAELRRGYSAKLVGEPGTGKSVCGYQAALDFARGGWCVFRFRDVSMENALFPLPSGTELTLLLVDDAHLMSPYGLRRLEESCGPRRLLLTLHNGIEKSGGKPNAVLLDGYRAVRTIAAVLRTDSLRTLAAVRRADDDVGVHHLDIPIERRIDDAERTSDRPWQFCFVLGGGWRRAKEAADAARIARSDIVLAAAAIHQIASRDAPLPKTDLAEFCTIAGIEKDMALHGTTWLVGRRLLLSEDDCRCPHQRFAAVVLHHILDGQNDQGRIAVAQLVKHVFDDIRYPLAGIRLLLDALSFASGQGSHKRWIKLIGAPALERLVQRCWKATGGEEIMFAALLLSDTHSYIETWQHGFTAQPIGTIASWISRPEPPSGHGLYRLVNTLHQHDPELAQAIVRASDPVALGDSLSRVTPATAFHLGEILKGVGIARSSEWAEKFECAWDSSACLSLAEHWPVTEPLVVFAKFCSAVSWWRADLALEMVERFVPAIQAAFADNPISAFEHLDDILMDVLRVSDPLGVYVGKLRPDTRRLRLAKSIVAKIDPTVLASQLSAIRKRDFQTATFLLGTLRKASKEKYDTTILALDWPRLEQTIGEDWAHLPHEMQIFLSVGHGNPAARGTLSDVVTRNLHRVKELPPRVAAVAPQAAMQHLESGKRVAIGQHDHFDWRFGAFLLATIAKEKPQLVDGLLIPSERMAAKALSQPHPSWYDEAASFLDVAKETAPSSIQRILDAIDVRNAEVGWTASLKAKPPMRRTVSILIDAALARDDAVGDMARRLRAHFPRLSVPKSPVRKRGGRRGVERERRR